MKTQIVVTLQIEGIHCWPEAKYVHSEVAYLSELHRHIFHIEARKEVKHSERDIEIIMFKRELHDYFMRNYFMTGVELCNFGPRSCETIAKDLMEAYDLDYCKVLEDNENGAVCLK